MCPDFLHKQCLTQSLSSFLILSTTSASLVPHLKNGDNRSLQHFLCLERKCLIGVSSDIMLDRHAATGT